MANRRDILKNVVLVGGVSVTGCLGKGTSTERSPTPDEFESCPESGYQQGAAQNLTLSELPTDGVAANSATTETPISDDYLRGRFIGLYRQWTAEEVEKRVNNDVEVGVEVDVTHDGEEAIGLVLIAWGDENKNIKEAPPVTFSDFIQRVPSTLTAPLVVNDQEYTQTVPVVAGCSVRQFGPD